MKSLLIKNDAEIKTVELNFNGKTYNVAGSLSVLSKLDKIPDDVSEIDELIKIIKILINDSVDRDRLLKGEDRKYVTEEEVALLVTAQTSAYYNAVIAEALGVSFPDAEPDKDEDGEETVVTDEMIEAYGDGEEKNSQAG